jgi:hypothetical protein
MVSREGEIETTVLWGSFVGLGMRWSCGKDGLGRREWGYELAPTRCFFCKISYLSISQCTKRFPVHLSVVFVRPS